MVTADQDMRLALALLYQKQKQKQTCPFTKKSVKHTLLGGSSVRAPKIYIYIYHLYHLDSPNILPNQFSGHGHT